MNTKLIDINEFITFSDNKKRFSDHEKLFLVSLIAKYSKIVEAKETNKQINQAKKRVWLQIQQAFNGEPEHTERTITQLQKCWDNIKSKRKKHLAKEYRLQMSNGEGSLKNFEDDPDVEAILQNTEDKTAENIDSVTDMLMSSNSSETIETLIIDNRDHCYTGTFSTETVDSPKEQITYRKLSKTNNEAADNKGKREGNKPSHKNKKRGVTANRQAALNLELKERLETFSDLTDYENEMHEIQKSEAMTKLLIQQQNLKTAEIETEIAKTRLKYEEEILKAKLNRCLSNNVLDQIS